MAIGRAAFTRPIEITATSKDVSLNGSSQSIATGTYGSIMTLLYEFKAHMTTAGIANATARINTTTGSATYGHVQFGSSADFAIIWTDAALATLFGFGSDPLTDASLYTAASPCPSAWISNYTPSDRETWALDLKSNYAGQLTRTGELVGAASGPDIYHRTLRFDGETGANVFRSLRGTYDRSLESFIVDSRTSVPTVSTNQPTKGFYYFFDAASLYTPLASMISGSITSWGSSSTYVWCYPDEKGLDPPRASYGVTRGYYGFDLRLHTGTAPTWNAP